MVKCAVVWATFVVIMQRKCECVGSDAIHFTCNFYGC